MRHLAGIQEASDILGPDDEDPDEIARENAQFAREAKITELIKRAFLQLRLDVADDGILYAEEDDREANVILDMSEIPLELLIGLQKSGLSDRYTIEPGRLEIIISFRVSPDLDRAVA